MTEPTPTIAHSSPSIADLAEALAKVQAELPEIDRDRDVKVTPKDPNKPSYSYSYVTLANLSKVVLPLLAKNGLSYVAMPGAGSDGKGMSVRYRLMHSSGEWLEGEFPISGEGGIQMIGGRITYARRYCLAALVGVAADEDDESRLAEGEGPRTAQRAPAARPRKTTQAAAQRAAATAPPPLPDEGPRMISQPMVGKLIGSMRAIGLDSSDGSDRKAVLVDMIGRQIASSKELTFEEGRAAIDAAAKAAKTDNPLTAIIEIYHRTMGGSDQTTVRAAAPAPRTARERTRDSVVGRPPLPGEEEPPPWETGPPSEETNPPPWADQDEWPETARPGGGA